MNKEILKEALKEICKGCEYSLSLAKMRCPFRSISNDYCNEYNLLKEWIENERSNEEIQKAVQK